MSSGSVKNVDNKSIYIPVDGPVTLNYESLQAPLKDLDGFVCYRDCALPDDPEPLRSLPMRVLRAVAVRFPLLLHVSRKYRRRAG